MGGSVFQLFLKGASVAQGVLRCCFHDTLDLPGFTPLWPEFGPGTGQKPYVSKFCQLLAVGRWFPPGAPVSSTSKN